VAGKCDICGKVPAAGRNIRHQARTSKWVRRAPKTNRSFSPNIQRTTITIGAVRRQINACTRCLRTAAKATRTA